MRKNNVLFSTPVMNPKTAGAGDHQSQAKKYLITRFLFIKYFEKDLARLRAAKRRAILNVWLACIAFSSAPDNGKMSKNAYFSRGEKLSGHSCWLQRANGTKRCASTHYYFINLCGDFQWRREKKNNKRMSEKARFNLLSTHQGREEYVRYSEDGFCSFALSQRTFVLWLPAACKWREYGYA